MKLVYPDGGVGVHMPYKYHEIKTPEDFEEHKKVFEFDEETGTATLVGMDDVTIEWELEDINYIAGKKITAVYPEHKQLNILRTGTVEQQAAMTTFIDAVRDWANSENPDPWDGTLDSIHP